MTLSNTKLLVKLLSPETANIKNLFNKNTLLYTKTVRDTNNVEARENSAVCVPGPSEPLSPGGVHSILRVPILRGHTTLFQLHQVPST